MLAKINSSAIIGIQACPISIEVSVTKGLGYQITGLADESIKESLSRIAIAIENAGYVMPRTKLLVHMSPATIRKSGSAYDLPIALGILLATGQITDNRKLDQYSIAGELSLDGTIKRINGALARSELIIRNNGKGLLIPPGNAHEAALFPNAKIFPVSHLREAIAFVCSDVTLPAFIPGVIENKPIKTLYDFKNVVGQENTKRALEIAAAGGHHVLISGFPGTAKSMLTKCLPSILPPMTQREMMEITKIQSLFSSPSLSTLITQRPYREVHHSITCAGLIGGGLHAAPGEITYAHNGVLFMDEFTEFKTTVLEALRQPLEEKKINVSRAASSIEYPADFMLVAAMNPCSCGYKNHPVKKCTCSPRALWWHRRKLSGPILDRFDLSVTTDITDAQDIFNPPDIIESSAIIRDRVINARNIQLKRLQQYAGISNNGQLTHELIQRYCTLDEHAKRFLQRSWERLQLSHRGLDKVLKVARTIADLHDHDQIELKDIAEAVYYKLTDDNNHAQKQIKYYD
jgi:magnesium chelatase family protein